MSRYTAVEENIIFIKNETVRNDLLRNSIFLSAHLWSRLNI